MKVWLNNDFIDAEDVSIPLLSHSFSRGSSIFEVIDIIQTVNGPAFFGLEEHIKRFYNSAEYTYMKLPVSGQELSTAIIDTVKKNNLQKGAVKVFAYYPASGLGLLPKDFSVDIAIFTIEFNELEITHDRLSKPVRAGISTFRKIMPDAVPVQAKVTGSYVNGFLAMMEVLKKGYDDVILLDSIGYITEGATSNVFFVKGNEIITPTLRNVLPGVTRSAVIDILKNNEYRVSEMDILPEDAFQCDEAFYSGSIDIIKPIVSIDGNPVGNVCPGPVTEILFNKVNEALSGRNRTFSKWLTLIK